MGFSCMDFRWERVLPKQSRSVYRRTMLRVLHGMRAATLMLALLMLAALLAGALAYFDVLVA